MSESNGNDIQQEPSITAAVSNKFSEQSTGLVETTLAETLGLSMHNAITNQKSSQMTTAASITNACARLLQANIVGKTQPKKPAAEPPVTIETSEPEPTEDAEPISKKKKFNLKNFLKPKSEATTEQDTVDEQTSSHTAETKS